MSFIEIGDHFKVKETNNTIAKLPDFVQRWSITVLYAFLLGALKYKGKMFHKNR